MFPEVELVSEKTITDKWHFYEWWCCFIPKFNMYIAKKYFNQGQPFVAQVFEIDINEAAGRPLRFSQD